MKPVTTICLLVCLGVGSAFAEGTSTREIDRDVWSVVSRTVVESDIEGMAAVYHSDAVLVAESGTGFIVFSQCRRNCYSYVCFKATR